MAEVPVENEVALEHGLCMTMSERDHDDAKTRPTSLQEWSADEDCVTLSIGRAGLAAGAPVDLDRRRLGVMSLYKFDPRPLISSIQPSTCLDLSYILSIQISTCFDQVDQQEILLRLLPTSRIVDLDNA